VEKTPLVLDITFLETLVLAYLVTVGAFGKFYPDGGQNYITLRKMCNPVKITA